MRALLKAAATLAAAACAAAAVSCTENQETLPGGERITNDCWWYTEQGTPINSQGGGIFRFDDPTTGEAAYYWYGVHYREADGYRQNPAKTLGGCTFEGVTCYKSTDLIRWTEVGHVLTKEEVNGEGRRAWVGRMGVAYVEEAGKYALLVQHGSLVLVALSDSPEGPFAVHTHIDLTDMIGYTGSGDQTVFTDPDTGRSYLVYSKPQGRDITYISEIGVMEDGTVGLLDCTEVFRGAGREGNCMFKHDGKYYLFASDLYGWDSSHAYWLVSDDVRGPYEPHDGMAVTKGCERDYAHITQTGFFYVLRGSLKETVIYCGDRWADFAGNGLGYNQWVPLSFDGDEPVFNSLSSWLLNPETGEWAVAPDNNYVLNCSFEADRRVVPMPSKPRQDFLLGWDTQVISGNSVGNDIPDSPQLNWLNTEQDRAMVIGEKSLRIDDTVDFSRIVSQRIASEPFFNLEDGNYLLSVMYRTEGDFSSLELFAQSARRFSVSLEPSQEWREASLEVRVRDSEVTVGISASGKAGALCLADDFSLRRR